jgi:hypothetical protein
MRVTFQTSGGIAYLPGLAAPTTIDTDTLSDEQRSELDALIRGAQFFDRPSARPAPRGAADYQTYTITIEEGGRRHTVTVTDASLDPGISALVDRLRVLSAAQRRGG